MIPLQGQEEVKTLLFGPSFGWFYHANTNDVSLQTQMNDMPQFCHGFIRDDKSNSSFSMIPLGILKGFGIGMDQIIRAKANLMSREPEWRLGPKHTDNEQPHIVFIYYVNDSDGDTHIWRKDGSVCKVSPKQGRGVFFDGQLLHAPSTPITHRNRVVINFNLKPGAINFEA